MKTKRYGAVIGVRDESIADYVRIHSEVWPGVLAKIKECNIRNYSIHLRRMPDGRAYLFSYYEYAGGDHAADMARMSADPLTQEWWKVCMPMQEPLADRPEGAWWAPCDEVFHLD
ncbi:MAG: L-rhamnose mutarotase [Opitutaceae bacterium]|nr:L-rhamnose mutarotase [Opitutaceae bacterium]